MEHRDQTNEEPPRAVVPLPDVATESSRAPDTSSQSRGAAGRTPRRGLCEPEGGSCAAAPQDPRYPRGTTVSIDTTLEQDGPMSKSKEGCVDRILALDAGQEDRAPGLGLRTLHNFQRGANPRRDRWRKPQTGPAPQMRRVCAMLKFKISKDEP
jgi:hypothetical protein